jgi:hypothetical protein
VRRLGEQLVYGISRSTVAPTIESRHPRAVVRLAYYALAELIIHGTHRTHHARTHTPHHTHTGGES